MTDGLLSAIHDRIAVVPPERGGAILGFDGLAHLLVEDDFGAYSGASWDISSQLSSAVGQLESQNLGQLLGTVHSHPSGVMDPSGTDLATTALTLQMNPHLGGLLIGVVTKGEPRREDIRIGVHHRMSMHVMYQGDDEPRQRVRRVAVTLVPLHEHLRHAGLSITAATSAVRWQPGNPAIEQEPGLNQILRVNGRHRLVVDLKSEDQTAFFIDADYPAVGPLIVAATTAAPDPASGTTAGHNLESRPTPWDPDADGAAQLRALAKASRRPPAEGFLARVEPMSGDLSSRRVLVVGLGSVGSVLCEALVRNGVRQFNLVDPDVVEAPNLSRTVYTVADLGTTKVSAMARRIRAIEPGATVLECNSQIGQAEIGQLINGVDLVVAATDDMADQATLAHHAYWAGIPLIACALYREAAAGEVVIVSPSAGTACWNCSVGGGSASDAMRPAKDYGLNGRLVAEVALGPSIHLVTNVAAIMAIGLLAQEGTSANRKLRPLLQQRRTLGLIAGSPEWEFFPKLFEGMNHQYAPQSVWVQVASREDCPICGQDRKAPPSEADGRELAELIARLGEPSAPVLNE